MAAINKKVYQAILVTNKLLEDYIGGVSFYSTMERFLELLLSSTNSENGFIGKVSGSNKQFTTLVCDKDADGMGLSLAQLRDSIGEITLNKTVTNYYDCTSATFRSYASVPLEFDGKLIGFIGLANKPGEYSKSDFEILRFAKNNVSSILNNQLSINVQHKKHHEYSASEVLPLHS